jgi:hypothetical protein
MRITLVVLLLMIAGDCYGKPQKFPKHHPHDSGGSQVTNNTNAPVVNIDNRSVPGPVQAGPSASISGGDTVTNTAINYRDDYPASTPAFVAPGECQTGSSGQGQDGGIALVTRNPLCDYWDAAEVALKAYKLEKTNATCRPTVCQINCDIDGFVHAEMLTCVDTPLGQKYLADYHHNIDMAQTLIDSSVVGDKVDRQVSAWSKVLFWLAVLVWLA